jgi:hypothetical protein
MPIEWAERSFEGTVWEKVVTRKVYNGLDEDNGITFDETVCLRIIQNNMSNYFYLSKCVKSSY